MIKKAQAAMEFLLTYGWAILVVVVVLVTLVQSGAINTDFLLPDECVLSAEITCVDYSIEGSQITVTLRNNFAQGITIDRIEVKNRKGGSCFSPVPKSLEPKEKATFVIFGCDNTVGGNRLYGDLEVTYKRKSVALPKVAAGNIVGRVEGGATGSSSSICEDADFNELCGGLDIVFGEGYRAACCIDHGLCCA